MEYNYLDIIIASILLGFAVRGFFKGLILSLASLVGLIAGLYVAWHFSDYLVKELASMFSFSEGTLKVLSFILTFVLVMFVVYLLGLLLEKVIKVAGLGYLNKLGGLLLGLIKGGLLLSILFYFFVLIGGPNWLNPKTLSGSLLYEPVSKLSSYVVDEMGEYLDRQNQPQDNQSGKTPDHARIY